MSISKKTLLTAISCLNLELTRHTIVQSRYCDEFKAMEQDYYNALRATADELIEALKQIEIEESKCPTCGVSPLEEDGKR